MEYLKTFESFTEKGGFIDKAKSKIKDIFKSKEQREEDERDADEEEIRKTETPEERGRRKMAYLDDTIKKHGWDK
jgi:hypothetical protein